MAFMKRYGHEPLRNPADDYSKEVFDDALRGRTDLFVFRFRKP